MLRTFGAFFAIIAHIYLFAEKYMHFSESSLTLAIPNLFKILKELPVLVITWGWKGNLSFEAWQKNCASDAKKKQDRQMVSSDNAQV